ncbi:uncharacterized protein LOC126378033 [Pectinophora gossypiella]|uniref:uncharacterized protein LOC126378033 n=1 Tax=Pectinophora gossypiella TaxID=13191 RepID=UPI00214E4E6C|nr:uncharacterized protein LOC126378033 [Pectinophora gossypiella]
MASFLPVTLAGDNLGTRHHQFNSLVNNSYEQNIPFSSIKNVEEYSPLDRLFKIDLASRYKNVEYILETFKDEDLLYVSRALKSKWLLDKEYSHIFNSAHLEDVLYPEMTTPAVSKVKHWIYLNLKDSQRSQEFYEYYKIKNFDTAIKFLRNCTSDFILREVPNFMEKLSPKLLKFLSEKCPEVAKIFFDSFQNDDKLASIYRRDERKYYSNLKFLLKINGDIFLDIAEKYVHFSRFSADATKFIMKHYKDRFNKKTELYATSFLDMKTLATCLSSEEIKEVVLKLARAQYIQFWFNYKNVEPLIKALSVEERKTFKKKVFVDKDVGELVDTWPYDKPTPPQGRGPGSNIFQDKQHDPEEYESLIGNAPISFRSCLKKRKCMKRSACQALACEMISVRKSSFDILFDKYRFISFGAALYELRKQMKVETTQHRQNIMLLLISKTGGHAQFVEELLTLFATQHHNEPDNLRATIIRSLVRRSCAWRLPQNVWEAMVKFGHGLGLDGQPSPVACSEGLHAVILRSILLDCTIEAPVWKAFLNNFSTLKEYSLNYEEKKKVYSKLPALLLDRAKNDSTQAIELLDKTLDVLDAYKLRADTCPHLVSSIASAARKDDKAEHLLRRLYTSRVARKQLFRENFAIFQTDESYLNALKHNTDIISSGETFEELIKTNKLDHDRFLRALSLYFNEENGLAQRYLTLLKKNVEKSPKIKVAHSIAILSGNEILDMILEYDAAPKQSELKRFSGALRANMHLARPSLELKNVGWQKLGAKAVANRILICRGNDIDQNIQTLLSWSRTLRLALVLSMRSGKEMDILTAIGDKRPTMILKTLLLHSRTKKLDERVWDVIITIIEKLHASDKLNSRTKKVLYNLNIVPASKKAKYCQMVYKVLQKGSEYAAVPMLSHAENILWDVDEEFIDKVTKEFMSKDFVLAKMPNKDYYYDMVITLHLRVVAKYLLLCKSEAEQEKRWKSLGEPVIDHCGKIWTGWQDKNDLTEYFNEFIQSLKFTKVFLDTQYVSCLPMIEKVINKLQTILPLHKFYNIYIHLHLTMLYFKTLRQAKKNNPIVFEDLPKNLDAATEIVGKIFGKYIAHEVIELMDTHFESMRELYKRDFVEYIRKYFEYGDNRSLFIANVIKGILDCENPRSHLVAEYLYDSESRLFPKNIKDDVFGLLEKDTSIEVQFFINAHNTPNPIIPRTL